MQDVTTSDDLDSDSDHLPKDRAEPSLTSRSTSSDWQPPLTVTARGPRYGLWGGTLVVFVLLAVGAYLTATRLPEGTTLAGQSVADASDGPAALDAAEAALQTLPVTFSTAAGSAVTLTGAELGLDVDADLSSQPIQTGIPSITTWFRRFVQGRQMEPFRTRPIELDQLTAVGDQLTVPPTDAGVLVRASGTEVTDPVDGLTTGPGDVDTALDDALSAITTVPSAEWPAELAVVVGGETTQPTVTQDDIANVLAQIEQFEQADVTLTADTPAPPADDADDADDAEDEDEGGSATADAREDTTISLSPRELRDLVEVGRDEAGALQLLPSIGAAPPRVVALLDLATIAPTVEAEIENRSPTPNADGDLTDVSSITGDLVLLGSEGGFEPDLEATLAAIIDAGERGGGEVDVDGTQGQQIDLADVGIVEPISTFTTFYTAGQSRNTNIQRMAEIVDGTIIPAGESFELNQAVGQRTRDSGFVEGGAIIDGELTTDVGGGVSQFATTLFNASWFAGIELVDWKAHSIYFSRYPAGREATVNFPNVNLEVRNDTPHAILVDTDTDDTSVTVTFWSLPYWDVQTISGPCACGGEFSINVDRIRTAPDANPITETWTTFYTVEQQPDE